MKPYTDLPLQSFPLGLAPTEDFCLTNLNGHKMIIFQLQHALHIDLGTQQALVLTSVPQDRDTPGRIQEPAASRKVLGLQWSGYLLCHERQVTALALITTKKQAQSL